MGNYVENGITFNNIYFEFKDGKIIKAEAGDKTKELNDKVNNFYSANKSNNTVIAKIKRDNVEYTAKKEFTFGQAGTNGTDCTLVIDLVDDQVGNPIVAITSGETPLFSSAVTLSFNSSQVLTSSGV